MINALGFHFSEEQEDVPLAWQPSHAPLAAPQAQPVLMRSAQHRVSVCLCVFVGVCVCVCVCAHSLLLLRHSSSEPTPHSHQNVSAMGAKHV